MSRPCSVLRVFTRASEGGNHLGVVTDLSGLTTDRMQEIATHLGFSETVFIDESSDVPSVRIFTPAMEMPFAGHPLVGAASVLLAKSDIDRLQCGIGEVCVRKEGDLFWVDAPMDVSNAALDGSGFAGSVGVVNTVSEWRVALPLDYRVVELTTFDDVANADPDTDRFGEVHGLTIYARYAARVRMRFFIPLAGIKEDPATGSAAVALATRLAADGEPSGDLTIEQGEEIGHPSRIKLRWQDATASIGGTVAIDADMELPI